MLANAGFPNPQSSHKYLRVRSTADETPLLAEMFYAMDLCSTAFKAFHFKAFHILVTEGRRG